MTATQAPTPGPLSGDDELIERGLRSIRTYDAVRSLRDALTATTARLTGYDWNADPDAITKQQGDAFAAADKVFADLDAAVAAHPEIDLPECEACNGTGKIEEPARTEGANQHSACVRSCDECDGCGFAPDESLAPTAPVEASGSEECSDLYRFDDPFNGSVTRLASWPEGLVLWHGGEIVWRSWGPKALRPQPSGETRALLERATEIANDVERGKRPKSDAVDMVRTLRDLLSARPLALGGQQGEEAAWSWLNRHVECDPADSDYSADEMVDAFMAGAGRYDIWLKALERIAGEQQHRSGYCQTDITVEPALTAEEAQTVARDALSTTPARAEAQDEGAAGDIEFPYQRTFNAIADAVSFTWAGDSGKPHTFNISVEAFQRSYNNGRQATHPSPPPAADEDRVRSALADLVTWFDKPVQGERGMIWVIRAGDQGADDAVAEALAALKSEGK